MIELVHMTAQYSNAVLLAVMPHISDFAAKMDLPIPQPITASQVARSAPLPYAGYVTAGVWLTNGYWFLFHWQGDGHHGLVTCFSTPTNWFREQEFSDESIVRYFGSDRMTTNEAIAMARATLKKAGFQPSVTHADEPPTEVQGPSDIKRLKAHVPYCQIEWEWPPGEDHLARDHNNIHVQINTESKTVVGISCTFAVTNRPPTVFVKPSVEPELEKDFRKRTRVPILTETNAPSRQP